MKTNKTKALKTFVELFDIILAGNKDNSRIAARKVRKLIYSLWKPAYKKYKYVNFLPACPYKSIQMALSAVSRLVIYLQYPRFSVQYRTELPKHRMFSLLL